MKLTRYAAVATAISALFLAGQAAFAQNADPSGANSPPAVSANSSKTRAEVRAELIQAEQQGLLPGSKNNYPPTPREMVKNRAEYQARHLGSHVALASS